MLNIIEIEFLIAHKIINRDRIFKLLSRFRLDHRSGRCCRQLSAQSHLQTKFLRNTILISPI